MSSSEKEEKEENSFGVVTEYVFKNFAPVLTIQEADFISFHRMHSELEMIFGEIEKFELNTELLKHFKHEHVEGLGEVWLIKRIEE